MTASRIVLIPSGARGLAGTNGTNGTNGADGKTVRNGTGVPSAGLGVDGDFYIDTAADAIYGPKTAGAWGSATSLVGPQGPEGDWSAPFEFNAQTGTTYTFVLADIGKIVTGSNASAQVYTVPTNASVPYDNGTSLAVLNLGAGLLTVVGDTGVTVSNPPGTSLVLPVGGMIQILKTGTNTWTAAGARVEDIIVAVGDESTAITTGAGKVAFNMPFAMFLLSVKANLNAASSSGVPTVDINEGAGAGTSILSTKLTIDESELTSATAATAAVISDANLANDARITIDIDTAGTGAAGLKVTLTGIRV